MNTNSHYHRSKHSRCLDESLDIDSALDAWDRSKYKERINKILLIEEPDRSHEHREEYDGTEH